MITTLALVLLISSTVYANTYTVTNNNDSGAGSLREAITNANANPGIDTIDFDAAMGGQTITLLSVLPDIEGVIIDGTTANDVGPGPDVSVVGDPAFYGTLMFPRIDGSVLKGIAVSGSFHCVVVGDTVSNITIGGTGARDGNTMDDCTHGLSFEYSSGGTVYHNVIGNSVGNTTSAINILGASNIVVGGSGANQRNILVNNDAGMRIGNASDITVKGNYIGTYDGTDNQGNSNWGILLEGSTANITIGGTNAGEGNVISGNDDSGICVAGTPDNIVIQGNSIGTSADGTADLGNGSEGIITTGNTTIGGTVAGSGNLISGNDSAGIRLQETGSNIVQGNIIGLNATGDATLANGVEGIIISSPNNLIGGNSISAQNTISGNTLDGIALDGSDTTNNTIELNYIGLKPDGSAAMPNGRHGIYVVNGAHDNNIGISNYGNVISGNAGHGISVHGENCTGNSIQANIIGLDSDGNIPVANTGSGIAVNAPDTIIGTTGDANAINVISGNNANGISIEGTGTNTSIFNNYIGVAPDGSTPKLNGQNGISLINTSNTNIIGDTNENAKNIIASNGGANACIIVDNTTGDYNELRGNDCLTEGTSLNLARNGTGNENIADPTVTEVSATTSFVEGTSIANGDIDIFVNGHYQASTTSDGDGYWYQNLAIPSGSKVSVSVTNANGSTSRTASQVLVADDDEIPAIPTITSPASGSSVSGSSITVSGTKPAYTSLWLDGIEVIENNASTTWTLPNFDLVLGNNGFIFTTQDLSSNESDEVPYSLTREASFSVTQTSGSTQVTESGNTDSYTIKLDSMPSANVSVKITYPRAHIRLTSANSVTTTSNSLTIRFTPENWNTNQTINITAFDDSIVEDNIITQITHTITTTDEDYTLISIDDISVTVIDNDTAGVLITESNGLTEITTSGDTDTYTIVLTSKPSQNVTIALHPDSNIETDPTSVIFTSDNWDTAQTITVYTEAATEETQSLITHTSTSSDADYQGIDIDDVQVSIALPTGGPTAKAGKDRSVLIKKSLLLNGELSEGNDLTYSWEITSGFGTLSHQTTSTPIFKASSSHGNVIISLTVTDANGQTDEDSVTIHVVDDVVEKTELQKPAVGSFGNIPLYESQTDDDTYLSVGTGKIKISDESESSDSLNSSTNGPEYALAMTSDNILIIGKPLNHSQKGVVYYTRKPVTELYGLHELDAQAWNKTFGRIIGVEEEGLFGCYLATGDINGDGEDEIIVGAPGATPYGKAYIFNHDFELISKVIGSKEYPVYSVLAGNFIETEYDDILFGPHNKALNYNLKRFDAPQGTELTQYSFLLSGVSEFESVIQLNDTLPDIIVGDNNHSFQSSALGDVNGDGYDDLILITSSEEIYLYFGPVDNDTDFLPDDADVIITKNYNEDDFGQIVISGDVTGDGIDDIIIGAPLYGTYTTGAVYVIFGRDSWETTIDIETDDNTVIITGESTNDQIGSDLFIADLDQTGTNAMHTIKQESTVYKLALNSTSPPTASSFEMGGSTANCQLQINIPKQSNLGPYFLFLLLLLYYIYLYYRSVKNKNNSKHRTPNTESRP